MEGVAEDGHTPYDCTSASKYSASSSGARRGRDANWHGLEVLEQRLLLAGAAPIFLEPLSDQWTTQDERVTVVIDTFDATSPASAQTSSASLDPRRKSPTPPSPTPPVKNRFG